MKIIYRGDEYDLPDPMHLVRPEASLVKEKTGFTLLELGQALQKVDLEALVVYLYIAKKRAGEKVRYEDLDDTSLSDFDWVTDEDEDDDLDEDELDAADDEASEADPT